LPKDVAEIIKELANSRKSNDLSFERDVISVPPGI
jgi:hypothetical protein